MNNFTVIKNSKITIIFIFMVMISFKSFSQTPDVDGQWSGVIPFDIVPVAIANLPDGRILTWSSKSKFQFGGGDGYTWTQIFDPTIGLDGAVLPEIVTNTNHDMFCPGINNLADGRIMATGGSSNGRATIYNPVTEIWEATDNMNYGRGYQGAVTLSDGSVFTIGGSWSGGNGVKDAELWTEASGWTILSGLEKTVLYNAQDDIYETQAGSYRLDNHAWLWAAPNGKIFHAGPGETMHWIDVTGNGSSTVVGQRGTVARPDIYAMNGTTVMFDIGKILKFGGSYTYSGGTPSSDNAYVIDFNDENNVTVTLTGNDAEEGRIFPTSVVLPNGEVMIIGGMDTSVPFSDNGAHLSLEIFNPDTNLFRTVVDMDEERTYHSAGVLMNDGRVFMGGGGLCGGCATNHANAEIYSPPYLFDNLGDLAVRPTLSAPNSAYYDNTFSVVTSPDVTEFAFIRMSSATHSVNNEQRRVPVTFSGSNGSFQLNMPNANIMPPGYYMLFAMNADGVPSISEAVLVGDLNLEDNLALNQPTSQSSLFPNGESFKAVDGNTSGDFNANPNSVTHTAAADNNAWWRVDLGDDYEYALDGIRIYNRSTFTERLTGATVYIGNIDSTDPADYTEVATLTADLTQVLTENMGIARYVMIRQSGILSLAEVQVFGQGINCPAQGTACDDGDVNTSNDIENGDCSCEGTIISCDNIEIVAEVDGESFSGETEITVTEDDDITLSLNLDDVVYTIEDPDSNILGSNIINEISFDQSGLYTLTSSVNGPITNPTLLMVDSVHPVGNNGALNAIDGDPNTFWHTEYFNVNDGTVDAPFDHEIQLDLGVEATVSGIEYLPRQGGPNGRIADYKVYVSNDPNNWGAPVSAGTWPNTAALQTVIFTETQARYVRLVAESEVNGEAWTSVAELNVIATGISECVKTLQISVTAKNCEELAIIYEINGESGTGETEITVTEGDDIGLFLNSDIPYTLEGPDGAVLGSNVINNIAFSQSGLYSVKSILTSPLNPNPTVFYVDSEELTNANNPATNAVDGDPNTIWHTQYSNDPDTPYPHEIQLDLGEESSVSGLEYLPRPTGGSINGTIAGYEIYVSNDTNNWGTAVSIGTWANNYDLKIVNFTETLGRYVRLVATSEVNGGAWASAAEIDIIGTVTEECVKTLQINVDTLACDDLAIVYDINGVSDTGATDITVTVGDDVELSLTSDNVPFTVSDPNGVLVPSNTINNISLGEAGLYTVTSTLSEFQGTPPDPIFVSVNSEQDFNNRGELALDGDPNTIWHTAWNPSVAHPHNMQLDLGDNAIVSGLTYLPRPGAQQNGRVANYEIYVSDDTNNWGVAVSTGTFLNTGALKTVNFTAVQGRYLRFVALSEVNGNDWASAAEIDVIRGPNVLYVDSEHPVGNNGAYNAIDGDPDTFWHTEYFNVNDGTVDALHDHEIQLDLGVESNVSGIEYLPRQNVANGRIADYKVYVSNDPNNWGVPVGAGTWPNSADLQTVVFPETLARYVRLVAETEVNGEAWTTVAELNVLTRVSTECIKTIQINVDTVTEYTYNNGWSPSDPNNVSNFNDTFLVEAGEAVISMNTISDEITVDPGAALTVNSGIVLTANTTTLKSTSQLYSSLMADGTLEGEIKYERFVNANLGGNDLVSPPLAGEAWIDFLGSDTNAADILNDGNADPQLRTYLFGPFDKIADSYVNYTGQNASTLISGTGYRAGTVVGANLTFTGTVPTTPIAVNIINSGATYPDWNLIGNPYPSYLDMDLFLNYVLYDDPDPDPSLDIKNIDILEDISGIYGYAGSAAANKWDVITLANASDKLMAPGQGFFVAANAADVAAYDITFDPSMRTIGADDDFVPGRNASQLTYLKLNAVTANTNYGTEFYFNANASLGLDLGYDGKILGNVAPNFALYSHLVEDNSGLPIALQALNPSDLTNTIIPLGVNSNQGEQITFSISETTLPSNVDVYLEDNVTNTVTLLNSGDYTFTPNVDLSGTGRFYLRVSSSVLSVGGNELDYIQIYTTTNPKSLIINGQLNGATMVSLYDIQGRLVINKPLNHLDVLNTIDISRIGTGVYIVKVSNDSQSKTQKLIIK